MNIEEINLNLKNPKIIAVITLLIVAFILVAGNLSFKVTEKATFNEFNKRQLVLAKGTTNGIELYFANLAGDMETIGKIPEIHHFEEATTRRQLQQFYDELEPWGVNDIALLDLNGILQYNVMANQLEGVDFSWRKYFQEAKNMTFDDHTYIIEFIEFKGVEAGKKGVLIAVPMFETLKDENHPYQQGEFVGVALSTLKLDIITQRFIAPLKSTERGHAFLIDGEYNVLWAADKSLFGKNILEESKGFSAFRQILEEMKAKRSGTAEYSYYKFDETTGKYTGDEEETLIAYTPIHLGKETWTIGVWAPKEDARKLIRNVYYNQLLLVGLITLIILLGSAYALAVSFDMSKMLEKEVKTKTSDLRKAHDELEIRVQERTAELLEVNKDLEEQIGERQLAEGALRESEEKFRTLAEKSPNMIFINKKGKVVYANEKCEEILGYTRDQFYSSDFDFISMIAPEHRGLVLENFRKHMEGAEVPPQDCTIVTKNGKRIDILQTTRLLKYEGDNAILGIITDITERKRAEEEMKRRLMKYSLEGGSLYLVKENLLNLSIEAFKDLLKVGYKGLVISRTPKEKIKDTIDVAAEFLWISESGGEKSLPPDLEEIEQVIENLPIESAILIDRLDYLAFKSGFDTTLTFVQRLSELAFNRRHVVILSVDPSIFSKRELRHLEKEASEVEILHKAGLKEDLLEILRFIYKQNSMGLKPSRTDVGTQLGISQPTVRKRIKQLISTGYLIELSIGRRKVLEMTGRGRSLFFE